MWYHIFSKILQSILLFVHEKRVCGSVSAVVMDSAAADCRLPTADFRLPQ
jgi:hypothetical protein